MLEGSSKFLCEKLSEIFTASGVVALQRSDTSWKTSRDDLQSTASYFPFLTSWDAIASAETKQWRGECRDLPVRLFKIIHVFRLEYEKSMLRTASTIDPSAFFKLGKQSCSSQPWVVYLKRLQKGFIEGFTLCIPTRNIVISIPAWDSLFGCFLDVIFGLLFLVFYFWYVIFGLLFLVCLMLGFDVGYIGDVIQLLRWRPKFF